MDEVSWLEGWASAMIGWLFSFLVYEISSYIRWRKRLEELKTQARIAAELASRAIETSRGIRP